MVITKNIDTRIHILENMIDNIRNNSLVLKVHELASSIKVIDEFDDENFSQLKVEGTAVTPGIHKSYNGVSLKYTSEEIKKNSATLIGKPIKIVHGKTGNQSPIGMVTDCWFDEYSNELKYKAIITDKYYAREIFKGNIKHVSVGTRSYHVPTDEDYSIGIGIEYDELSLITSGNNPGDIKSSIMVNK